MNIFKAFVGGDDAVTSALKKVRLPREEYIELMRELIGVASELQNSPQEGLVPKEDLAGDILLKRLLPHSTEKGGVLEIERVTFVEGRGNIIIKYPGTTEETVGFVGSHLDCVPANPENWDYDPFKLTVVGDKLYGRGTTDCLGHVALITLLFIELAKLRLPLKRTVATVFIVGEESGDAVAGVDAVMETGKIDFLKNGPVIWCDCADSEPCLGTAGTLQWRLRAEGKLFHSGLPHRGINSIELMMDAIQEIQRRFYEDFPAHPMEKKYNYATPSTLKPTQLDCAKGSINQLPPYCTASGDIRLTPFYEVKDVQRKIEEYVADFNKNPRVLEGGKHGPASKYVLAEGEPNEIKAKFTLEWLGEGMEGIACSMDTEGHQLLCQAHKEVRGDVKPYSICGSLPLVRNMQRAGFDIQLVGYGLSTVYHADNEYCNVKDMEDAVKIMCVLISDCEAKTKVGGK